uniref:Uncharacterized protein n=1 Tax=Anguilla anguilla TaxID=7936 RepID=A0A0E9X2V6_ANGAN
MATIRLSLSNIIDLNSEHFIKGGKGKHDHNSCSSVETPAQSSSNSCILTLTSIRQPGNSFTAKKKENKNAKTKHFKNQKIPHLFVFFVVVNNPPLLCTLVFTENG